MEQIALIINNIGWRLTILLAFLVCIIFVLRIVGKKHGRDSWIKKLNRTLRKLHKQLGIGLVVVALLHGIFAYISIFYTSALPFAVLDFKWGIMCFTVLLLLWASYVFRKKLKPNWIFWHRRLTIVFLITLVIHIAIETHGF